MRRLFLRILAVLLPTKPIARCCYARRNPLRAMTTLEAPNHAMQYIFFLFFGVATFGLVGRGEFPRPGSRKLLC